ncbi:serine/threonine protein kinase [Acidimangrovimonas pyrenivorans]|uniref:Serine/threonine protein kinase n=1 Tax=Acidimangrovimonas pyrenivorans TaxID=2030798 RepID=A0ABV7AK37_9RHOB
MPDDPFPDFVPVTVHKRDVFSETVSGHLRDAPEATVVLRRIDHTPLWARPIAWLLIRREIRALRAAKGIAGAPQLVRVGRLALLRSWIAGTPLQFARPAGPEWYRDARRLLREMRRRGITHNDVAKPQNWLMTPDGRAAVIDFQLASRHRRRGRYFRTLAREDMRHMLKQKRAFAPDLLTPAERKMLARKAWPSRVWMATGKRVYNFVTRRLMHWSDGEGSGNRLAEDGPKIRAALEPRAEIAEVAICAYPQPAGGTGLYVFAETGLSDKRLRALVPARLAELVQPVPALPRGPNGELRDDLLQLVAMNRLDELEPKLAADPALDDLMAPIVNQRRNLKDRYDKAAGPGKDRPSVQGAF